MKIIITLLVVFLSLQQVYSFCSTPGYEDVGGICIPSDCVQVAGTASTIEMKAFTNYSTQKRELKVTFEPVLQENNSQLYGCMDKSVILYNYDKSMSKTLITKRMYTNSFVLSEDDLRYNCYSQQCNFEYMLQLPNLFTVKFDVNMILENTNNEEQAISENDKLQWPSGTNYRKQYTFVAQVQLQKGFLSK